MSGGDRPGAGPATRVDHETEEPEPDASAEWLAQDQIIDRYHVLECLGVGGMGVIYSAWDPQLERKLAIKLVRARSGGPSSKRSRARLMREARALARLRHPNVVAVHDVGVHDGRIFVAMEFVAGETLHRWLLRSPPPPAERLLDVFLQVGRGLAAAHRAGFVHRDVKPENVMIGADGRVLILDFGIARETFGSESDVLPDGDLAPGDADQSAAFEHDGDPFEESFGDPFDALPDSQSGPLTRAGAVIGTPAYMSPEQHRGQRVDARSDQFSFCVVMWEALNGEKPYGEGSRAKLLARMRIGQLRRFHNRGVPRRVVTTLTRGLSWHPGERFKHMELLLEQLNPRRNRLFEQRRLWHGLGLGALAGVLLGVGLHAAISTEGGELDAPLDTCASLRWSEALEAVWSTPTSDQLRARFASAGSGASELGWTQSKAQLDAWSARWLDARTQTCSDHFERRRDSAARHDTRVACLDAQLERFAALLERLTAASAEQLANAQTAALALPAPERCSEPDSRPSAALDPSPAQRELEAAIEDLELGARLGDPRGDEPEHLARLSASARELGDVALGARVARLEIQRLRARGRLEQASERALEAASVAAGAGARVSQATLLLLAVELLSERGRDEEARHWLALAAKLAPDEQESESLGQRSWQLAMLETRARVELEGGRVHRARQHLLEARAMLEREPRSSPLARARVLHALARVELQLGFAAEALELLREATRLHTRELGDTQLALVELWTDTGRALLQLGDETAALTEYERALELSETPSAGRHRARVHTQIATLHARAGRCDAAWLEFQRAREHARASAEGSLLLAAVLEAQALACASSHPEASVFAHEAVELRERIQGRHHHALASPLLAEALALLAQDQLPAAEARMERAASLLTGQASHGRHLLALARGLALCARGQDEAARAQLDAAAAGLDPASEHQSRIREALAGLNAP